MYTPNVLSYRTKKEKLKKTGILIKVFGGSFSHFNEDNNNYFRRKDIPTRRRKMRTVLSVYAFCSFSLRVQLYVSGKKSSTISYILMYYVYMAVRCI